MGLPEVHLFSCFYRKMATESCALRFGKHRGELVSEVPAEYLKYLCCYRIWRDLNGVHREDRCHWAGAKFLWERHPDVIAEARRQAADRNLCLWCFRHLVPIGNAREKGRGHDDWDERFLHKKCWRGLPEYDRDVSEESE